MGCPRRSGPLLPLSAVKSHEDQVPALPENKRSREGARAGHVCGSEHVAGDVRPSPWLGGRGSRLVQRDTRAHGRASPVSMRTRGSEP